jgi:hypothetical protein
MMAPALFLLIVALQQPPAPQPQQPPAAPAQQPVEQAKPGAEQPKPPPPPPPPAYSYNSEGRRDPFVSLLTASDPRSMAQRPPGPAGLLISEVSVKGIFRDRSGFIALVQGTDSRTYSVRTGEKLLDGSIKAITADTVVFSQDVNDPLSTVKQKEVRKSVRPADGRG